ncbi:hypothetical protein ISCGN_027784 [Ixodes scapularis]
MPFSPDTGKPRTARRGRANPHGSGPVETPLSKHLLSQILKEPSTTCPTIWSLNSWQPLAAERRCTITSAIFSATGLPASFLVTFAPPPLRWQTVVLRKALYSLPACLTLLCEDSLPFWMRSQMSAMQFMQMTLLSG